MSQKYEEAELIYGLEDKPNPAASLMVGLQHLMGMMVGIILPSVLIADALALPADMKIYLINTALFVSGIGTILQVYPIGPIGSGMLTMQGTSFIFVSALIGVGAVAKAGGADASGMLAAMSGMALIGAVFQIILSRLAPLLRVVFTPLVCGITVTLVGLSLLEMAMRDACGGFLAQQQGTFAQPAYLGLAMAVVCFILLLQRVKTSILRACAILLGLLGGCALAWGFEKMGIISFGTDLSTLSLDFAGSLPVPLKHGISFQSGAVLSFALLYIVSTVEAVGDITATALVSKRPVHGPEYFKRLSGGICCDGVASAIAALFNSFPMAIFALNNGVIQITGVASRRVGLYVGGIMILAGLFPVVGTLFSLVPAPVMGGAMLMVFGTVAAAGIKIIASVNLDKRALTITGLSFGIGLGVAFVPEVSSGLGVLGQLASSAVSAGSFTAIILHLCLPKEQNCASTLPASPPIA